ncbi:aldose epimerase [Mycobacterium sp. MS1601]|uniref:aldose 1-epimerase n=1 Tax=Mycobacterium sp. MS1601 TaxID=1936029 RepID=UPI0009792610|nr:aldose 1-epimerase [Mycobacterium sp. MS1601]AQA03730.1 aldose epimerase [Mycobacterium sp. MS1601]
MHIVTLTDGPVSAQFVPCAGMIGISLTDNGVELLGQRRGLDTYISAGKTMGLPLLYPWANRLSVNTFAADAAGVRTDANGLPIHGLLAAHPDWQVLTESPGELLARFDFAAHPELLASFPYPHTLDIAVTLAARTLTLRTTVTATGEVAVPLCFGFHPYLQIPGVPRAQWLVETPALRHLPVDERGLPTGESTGQPAAQQLLGDTGFDDGYDQVGDGSVFAVSAGGRRIEVQFLEGYPAAQIFAPPAEDLICFEPMAAPTDALTRGGYRTAVPGSPGVASFSIMV